MSNVVSEIQTSKKRVILLSMIKNETRIIRRLIKSTLPIADAICICDTGSTDNTIEVLTDYFKEFTIPTKVFSGPEHLWKNFGTNRSQSFLAVQTFCADLGWDPEHTYALVMDADMELVILPAFKKDDLKLIGYKMIQKSNALEYYNTRFLQLSYPWKCVGPTHEYWDGVNTGTIPMDTIYISDIGDGGCKSDKFERDIRLLEEALVESPNNPRYLFYLAQSYKDCGQIDKAIEMYKKRIDAGGWYEEIWYSMYVLMKLYAGKNMTPEMEMWGLKAYDYRKERSENLLFLCRHFKDKRQYYKAWHYYELGSKIKKPNDLLFIESKAYENSFDFERTIIHDYVFPHKKQQTLEYSLNYYNTWGEFCCYGNIQWFVQKIPATIRELEFQPIGDFLPTSTCILRRPEDGKYSVNVRYVNYRIQPNGSYLMMKNGVLSGDHDVRTENYSCIMDASYNILSPLQKMECAEPPPRQTRIQGFEDVRLFYNGFGKMKFICTSQNYSYNDKIRQISGDYNLATGKMENSMALKPPIETDCEKNWIPFKGNKFIYGWHPFQIVAVEPDGSTAITTKQTTPRFLSHMRGSSTLVRDGEYFYGITHCVIYQTPRKYYHMVVKIHAETERLVGYTYPFYFKSNAIEYCLGFDKCEDTYTAIVSQNDCNPIFVQIKDSDLVWNSLS
jgi:glycosyltransferase involved in cell wall biosynthesis